MIDYRDEYGLKKNAGMSEISPFARNIAPKNV
jgi:hypothetical protein